MRRALACTVAAALLLSGCTSQDDHHDESMADAVTFSEQWVSASDTGMVGVFGNLTNTGHHDARIVGGESPAAGRVEVHEVVADGGGKSMRPKAGGIAVPAGGSHQLAPGGDHLMLMDLREPMQPGVDVALTVLFEDGSALPVTAQVRDFPGADEEYHPAASPHHRG
jgi:periplasmic copper chaperone A